MHKNNNLYSRNKVKYVSFAFASALRNFNPLSSLHKSYLGTILCNSTLLTQEDNTLIGTYCKQRWCPLCNRIRSAELQNGYESQLKEFTEPYFVTLTCRTVAGENLARRIALFEGEWRNILKNVSKKKAFKEFKGLRKMECTIRPQDQYHYHYHIIINGKAQGEYLIAQWLKRFPLQSTRSAQDMRPADQGSMRELFKYFTKLLVKDDGLLPSPKRKISQFKRLDFLFVALRNKRVFQPFGGLKKISEDIEVELIPTERPEGMEG